MTAKRRTTLPKNFAELIAAAEIGELKQVFETCQLDAVGGAGKRVALAFDECPDELTRWLVAEGADLVARDSRGCTPLHIRASSWRSNVALLLELGAPIDDQATAAGTPLHEATRTFRVANARVLIDHGADVNALHPKGLTALSLALTVCQNAQLEYTAELAELLIEAGAQPSPDDAERVKRIGARFEQYRDGFNPDTVDQASAALDRLYELFEVAPAPQHVRHDGVSEIVVEPGRWQAQHNQLFQFLVPPSGTAPTVQGEMIRITGRVGDELERNGGVNWDADHELMTQALVAHLASATPLSPAELAEAEQLAPAVRSTPDAPNRLAELAVRWVTVNPSPISLDPPAYNR